MRLTTEEQQYFEIFLWKDYSEKVTVKREELKPVKKFDTIYNTADKIIRKTQKIRLT
jgi:hypothetical protein